MARVDGASGELFTINVDAGCTQLLNATVSNGSPIFQYTHEPSCAHDAVTCFRTSFWDFSFAPYYSADGAKIDRYLFSSSTDAGPIVFESRRLWANASSLRLATTQERMNYGVSICLRRTGSALVISSGTPDDLTTATMWKRAVIAFAMSLSLIVLITGVIMMLVSIGKLVSFLRMRRQAAYSSLHTAPSNSDNNSINE